MNQIFLFYSHSKIRYYQCIFENSYSKLLKWASLTGLVIAQSPASYLSSPKALPNQPRFDLSPSGFKAIDLIVRSQVVSLPFLGKEATCFAKLYFTERENVRVK